MQTIDIWLTPEQETATSSEKEVAVALGISIEVLKNRLKIYGIDHCLTYYPGSIPYKVRRFKEGKHKNSSLGNIKRDGIRLEIDNRSATDFVTALIKFSKDQYENKGCLESKAFLLNENGMLEWYLEAYPGVNAQAIVEKLETWVRNLG